MKQPRKELQQEIKRGKTGVFRRRGCIYSDRATWKTKINTTATWNSPDMATLLRVWMELPQSHFLSPHTTKVITRAAAKPVLHTVAPNLQHPHTACLPPPALGTQEAPSSRRCQAARNHQKESPQSTSPLTVRWLGRDQRGESATSRAAVSCRMTETWFMISSSSPPYPSLTTAPDGAAYGPETWSAPCRTLRPGRRWGHGYSRVFNLLMLLTSEGFSTAESYYDK